MQGTKILAFRLRREEAVLVERLARSRGVRTGTMIRFWVSQALKMQGTKYLINRSEDEIKHDKQDSSGS